MDTSLVHILIFCGGLIAAFLGNYFKIASDISYIKGQLSQLLETHAEVTSLVEKYATLDRDFTKILKDLDKAFLRIKVIESTILQGGKHYGPST